MVVGVWIAWKDEPATARQVPVTHSLLHIIHLQVIFTKMSPDEELVTMLL